MRTISLSSKCLGWAFLLVVLGMTAAPLQSAAEKKDEKKDIPKLDPAKVPGVEKISEPVTHKNLSIFLLRGKDTNPDLKWMSLEEAIEKKKIVVHETKNVNQLSIENVSTEEIFVHMGDIVRGGSQDRLIVYDMIVPPQSGKMPLASFCVESGRWAARGAEDAKMFNASKNQAGKSFKYAANAAMAQSVVWEQVAAAQTKLARNVQAKVANPQSPSSLQLTLEDKKVLENVANYEKAFADLLKDKNDVIGLAVAVNGKVESVDIYASSALFQKFAKKLIGAACVDALSDLDEKKKFNAVTSRDVEAFLAEKLGEPKEQSPTFIQQGYGRQAPNAPNGQEQRQQIEPPVQQPNPPAQAQQPIPQQPAPPPEPIKTETHVRIFKYENDKVLMVESRVKKHPDGVIHRSYLAKEEKKPVTQQPEQRREPRNNPLPAPNP
jgi:hypothetical protein